MASRRVLSGLRAVRQPPPPLLLLLLLLGPWAAAGHAGKYSREKNEPAPPSKREPAAEFRMEKLNQLWEKAQRLNLPPLKLSDLHADLKIQERDEFKWKKLKAEGLDEDGEEEAKLVRSLSGTSLLAPLSSGQGQWSPRLRLQLGVLTWSVGRTRVRTAPVSLSPAGQAALFVWTVVTPARRLRELAWRVGLEAGLTADPPPQAKSSRTAGPPLGLHLLWDQMAGFGLVNLCSWSKGGPRCQACAESRPGVVEGLAGSRPGVLLGSIPMPGSLGGLPAICPGGGQVWAPALPREWAPGRSPEALPVQAKTSGKFSSEELDKLWRELQHHKEKVQEYHALLETLGGAEGAPCAVGAQTVPERGCRLSAGTRSASRGRWHTPWASRAGVTARLHSRAEFTEPRVLDLWDMAKSANFTEKELESFREELKHFEVKIEKHNHYQKQLEISHQKLKHVESFGDQQHVTRNRERYATLEERTKELGYKVKKHMQDLSSRISRARHNEL
ncbi:PREDICTED: alpha-2-macroglobulin receptor-associated protein-like [Bison bison bison]|uniref:Alpha-2-macroglobulin receptor-associated protein-like n=1 Tax=Bison bison bison TaxID=43346 RepID=A0A6P3GQR5_BISBB|nr:PREDICTED: alpha-2-macroglobulin receptor-associated protein-like [Bison bison bison]